MYKTFDVFEICNGLYNYFLCYNEDQSFVEVHPPNTSHNLNEQILVNVKSVWAESAYDAICKYRKW